MKKKTSDEMLMLQLAHGNKNAAGILYDRNYKQVYGYFVRMTNDIDVSRDLTQNVFLKIMKYSHSWKEDKVFAYWMFRIARNILVDYYNGSRKFFGLEVEKEIAEMDMSESVRAMEAKES